MDLAAELGSEWLAKGYLTGSLIEIEELIGAVDAVLRAGATLTMPSVTVAPRRGVNQLPLPEGL
jgi:hypothetical protein